MRNFTIFTLLSLLLVLATATLPRDARAAELAEDGWSNAFHQAFDNEKDPAKRLKALRDEQGRQQAWLDAAVKRANKKMPATVKKQFAASQGKWEKWYGLERKFLEAISPNGTLSEELEHYLLGILVLRTNFMRVQPMNDTDIDTKDRYVPRPIVFAKVRDGMPRDPDGMISEREEETTEDGRVVAPNLAVSMEHEIQDKWLNADFKALRDKLDDAQKIALRDTQRAWLQWHDADMEYLHAVIGDNGVREWFRWRELRKFTLRTVQIEYLLGKMGSQK